MEELDIRPVIAAIKRTVEKHELKDKGAYCRWLWGGTVWGGDSAPRELGKNEYGCADAANILYTINEFYCDVFLNLFKDVFMLLGLLIFLLISLIFVNAHIIL
jgi:hypothetical protein